MHGALVGDALYFFSCDDVPVLHRYDPTTGRDEALGAAEDHEAYGLAVSPDEQTILFTKAVRRGSDIMLIENFR